MGLASWQTHAHTHNHTHTHTQPHNEANNNEVLLLFDIFYIQLHTATARANLLWVRNNFHDGAEANLNNVFTWKSINTNNIYLRSAGAGDVYVCLYTPRCGRNQGQLLTAINWQIVCK